MNTNMISLLCPTTMTVDTFSPTLRYQQRITTVIHFVRSPGLLSSDRLGSICVRGCLYILQMNVVLLFNRRVN